MLSASRNNISIEIKNIPKDKTITYERITVDYREQKEDPYRMKLTVGGNLIRYDGLIISTTANLITSKLMWNSIISIIGVRYICLDIKKLKTLMKHPKYMKIKAELVPEEFI